MKEDPNDLFKILVAFVVGILSFGIALGIFYLLGAVSVTIPNGTQTITKHLIPSAVSQPVNGIIPTVITVVIFVVVVLLLMPIIKYLYDVFRESGALQ
jgi:TM2 domain-containing membrane protein YozV